MIEFTNDPIDATNAIQGITSPNCGAVVLFLGTTRQWTKGKETTLLAYECYEAMALKELEKLEAEARAKWPIEGCLIVHRLGIVPIAEASVLVAVSSPHRSDAFDAARYLIDTLKEHVPIWKKEHWADGDSEWVHPSSG